MLVFRSSEQNFPRGSSIREGSRSDGSAGGMEGSGKWPIVPIAPAAFRIPADSEPDLAVWGEALPNEDSRHTVPAILFSARTGRPCSELPDVISCEGNR